MIDLLAYLVLRFFWGIVRLFPFRTRVQIFAFFVRIAYWVVPSLARVTLHNLRFAFPDRDEGWYRKILKETQENLALLIADFTRIPELTMEWVEAHVEVPDLQKYKELKRKYPEKGIVLATGHLGSFELYAQTIALLGYPISYIVRALKLPRIDRFCNRIREWHGDRVIQRKGAVKTLMQNLGSGMDVGILFDQNVTRNHAVFVEWFGRKAATTRALAVSALRNRSVVLVTCIVNVSFDRYRIDLLECDFSTLYADTVKSDEEKVFLITQKVSDEFQKMIRANPGQWFWMHKRWKTSPVGVEEDFYG